jgi:3'-phosphoadenosine 5'-phosphosulfate sulfotransferase (PAPS reductase)/FAD synthetase
MTIIDKLIDRGALFVANHSGGKDSQAMLIRLLESIPPAQLVVVHASLGEVEWPGALELARDQAEAAGVRFIVAKSNTKTLLSMVQNRFETRPDVPSWPSSSTRQCTSDLKRGPIQRVVRGYAKANKFKIIVNCLGIRAEESPARSKKVVFKELDISNSVNTWYEWLPIHQFSPAQVFETIKQAGQEPHYAYALGNERLSCVFCIMGSENDIKNGARHNPELLAKYAAMEQRTGYTMHMNRRSIIEIVEQK